MAPFHFHSIFKKTIGCAPLEYLRSRRLSEAAEELLRSSASTEKVGARYGYGSIEAFARAFRSHFCIWPAEYRSHGLDLFLMHTELMYPTTFASATIPERADICWKPAKTLYGLFLDGDNIHEDNMQLLYRFMNTAKTSMPELDWIIADRDLINSTSKYSFFVGHESATFSKIPKELQPLEIPERLELEFQFHGSLDDLHGDFRSSTIANCLNQHKCVQLPSEWKLERRISTPFFARRSYQLNIPIAFRNPDHTLR
jgi:hypothetical protein